MADYNAPRRDEKGNLIEGKKDDNKDTLVKGAVQDASGLGSKVKGTAFTPPKQDEGEDSMAYGARVAAARRKFEAAQSAGQTQALRGMK